MLDASPSPLTDDKSLGTDSATGKLTAANMFPGEDVDPKSAIASLLQESEDELARSGVIDFNNEVLKYLYYRARF